MDGFDLTVDKVAASKFLSLLLRHKPEEIGLCLDGEGWALIDDLVRLTEYGHMPLNRSLIEEIVAASDKQRFKLSADGQRIRANQGHSVPVDLGLQAKAPPEVLFHGTARKFLEAILREGLIKGARQHVHLSQERETARRVGERRGAAVILEVRSGEMSRAGIPFFLSENGVWLTDSVPPEYLSDLSKND